MRFTDEIARKIVWNRFINGQLEIRGHHDFLRRGEIKNISVTKKTLRFDFVWFAQRGKCHRGEMYHETWVNTQTKSYEIDLSFLNEIFFQKRRISIQSYYCDDSFTLYPPNDESNLDFNTVEQGSEDLAWYYERALLRML